MNHQKGFSTIVLLIVVIVVLLGVVGYFAFVKKSEPVAQQPTPTPTQPQLDLNTIFGLTQKSAGTKIYYSDKLGIGFTYNLGSDTSTKINETGNTIYVGTQAVEVFSKDPMATLAQAIISKFLTGYDPKNCWAVSIAGQQGLANYVAAQITYPPVNDLNEMIRAQAKCPANYTKTNAAGYYFAMNADIPNKFFFVRLGQDVAAEDGTGSHGWDYSIRILK